jgi:hypothetical protein
MPAAAAKDRVLATWGWLALVAHGLVMAAAAISIPARLATRVAVSDRLRYQ